LRQFNKNNFVVNDLKNTAAHLRHYKLAESQNDMPTSIIATVDKLTLTEKLRYNSIILR